MYESLIVIDNNSDAPFGACGSAIPFVEPEQRLLGGDTILSDEISRPKPAEISLRVF